MIWYELGIAHFSVIYPVKTEEEYCVITGGSMEAVAQEAGNKAVRMCPEQKAEFLIPGFTQVVT